MTSSGRKQTGGRMIGRRGLLRITGGSLLGLGAAKVTTAAAATTGGSERWKFETGDGVWSSPTVVDGTVFVGSEDGHVYAIDIKDGSEVWQFKTGGWVFSSPTVIDDTVFIGSHDSHVYALDAKDGSELWTFETGDEVWSSPTVADGIVFVGGDDTLVYAIDANDGSELWSFETGNSVWSSPTVVNGTVFIGSKDSHVYALDAEDGSEVWQFETDSPIRSSPTVADGTVFVGSNDTHVYALDAENGSELWSFETDWLVWSSPTVADGRVFVGSRDEHMYVLDIEDGSELWHFETGSEADSSPTVVDGTVFFGSYDNHLYALDAEDGSEQWAIGVDDGIRSSPTVANGTVFVGSLDNHLYALDAGVDGSSEDSRVRLGTHGHHDEWVGEGEDDQEEDDDEDETLFKEDFESHASGDVPDSFVLAGNDDQAVVETTAATGRQSYKMSGAHGSCWRAIMRRELFDDTDRPDSMRIRGYFMRGDGEVGCHEERSGRIGWRTVESTDWSDGSGTELLQFRPDDEVTVAGETVGTYEPGEWVPFDVEYDWDRDAGTVTHTCRVGDDQKGTAVRDARDDEADLTALELRSDDYTVYWDDFVVETIDETGELPEISIVDFDVPNNSVDPGESVDASVTVENDDSQQRDVFTGYSVISPDGRVLDNEGTTGEVVTLDAGERTTVDVSWLAPTTEPSGAYDAVTAIWAETDRNALETRLDRAVEEDAFELEDGDLPPGASILSPVKPSEFPYQHTQDLVYEDLGPDREGVEGDGIRIEVDQEFLAEDRVEVSVHLDSPDESLLEGFSGYHASQLLVMFDETALSVDPDAVRSQVDGGTPRAVAIASKVMSLASLVSGPATSVKEALREIIKTVASEVAEEWATSLLTFETPPSFESAEETSVLAVDFSTDTVPEATNPVEFDEFGFEAEFVIEDSDADPTVSVFADLRGQTESIFTPFEETSQVTGASLQTHQYPVEYRRQIDVTVSRAISERQSERDEDDEWRTDDETPGFGIPTAVTTLGGAAYIIKRRLGDASDRTE